MSRAKNYNILWAWSNTVTGRMERHCR